MVFESCCITSVKPLISIYIESLVSISFFIIWCRQKFFEEIIVINFILVYPLILAIWKRLEYSLKHPYIWEYPVNKFKLWLHWSPKVVRDNVFHKSFYNFQKYHSFWNVLFASTNIWKIVVFNTPKFHILLAQN